MHIRNKKTMLLFAVALMSASLLKAQTENTHERLITQLKNGTAPRLQFANSQPAAAMANNNTTALQQKESLITQIRKGTAPGMKFQAGTGAATAARTAIPRVRGTAATTPKTMGKQGPLASEMEIPKELPKTVAVPAAPGQEEAAPAAPAGKQ